MRNLLITLALVLFTTPAQAQIQPEIIQLGLATTQFQTHLTLSAMNIPESRGYVLAITHTNEVQHQRLPLDCLTPACTITINLWTPDRRIIRIPVNVVPMRNGATGDTFLVVTSGETQILSALATSHQIGFANLSSMGYMIGGVGSLEYPRRITVAQARHIRRNLGSSRLMIAFLRRGM